MSQENFYFEFNLLQKELPAKINLEEKAFKYNSTGIEEYSLEEAEVDNILGARSYSGGDLPISVLDEVEETLELASKKVFKIYFQTLDDANNFKSFLRDELNIEADFDQKEVQDWNQEWRQHYEPIWVSNELEIIPAWDDLHQSSTDKQLLIYPGMGFGTGSHETTFLCLKNYLEFRKQFKIKRCLDFGCGSGILGLAVLLFNKNCEIDLYDIDDEAIHNCKQNIELNKLEECKINLFGNADKNKISGKYELVFANILQNVLLHEQTIILDSLACGGLLILSGLLSGQEESVIKAYKEKDKNIDVLAVTQKNDWISVVLRKL